MKQKVIALLLAASVIVSFAGCASATGQKQVHLFLLG